VVELHPEAGTAEGGVLGQPVMDQLGLQFSPGLLIVRAGQPVTFTNSETLSHNVHVTSVEGGETLLSADTEPSSRMEFVFAEAGGYNVSCDTHPGMTAFIYAATGPHAVFATRDGQFTLDRVPPGRYRASVWSVDPALRAERVVEVGAEPLGIDFTDGG
jgi:plastocyanin